MKIQTKLLAKFQWSFLLELNPLKRNLGITESCPQWGKKIYSPSMICSSDKPYFQAPVLNGTFLQLKHFFPLWFLYRKVSLFYTWIIVLYAVITRELVHSPGTSNSQYSAHCSTKAGTDISILLHFDYKLLLLLAPPHPKKKSVLIKVLQTPNKNQLTLFFVKLYPTITPSSKVF